MLSGDADEDKLLYSSILCLFSATICSQRGHLLDRLSLSCNYMIDSATIQKYHREHYVFAYDHIVNWPYINTFLRISHLIRALNSHQRLTSLKCRHLYKYKSILFCCVAEHVPNHEDKHFTQKQPTTYFLSYVLGINDA